MTILLNNYIVHMGLFSYDKQAILTGASIPTTSSFVWVWVSDGWADSHVCYYRCCGQCGVFVQKKQRI